MKLLENQPDNRELVGNPTTSIPFVCSRQTGELILKSRSKPEDIGQYLQKIRDKVEEYIRHPEPSTTLIINLEYLKEITTHYLFGIIRILYQACNNFFVYWEYKAGDEASLEQGYILASLCKAKFRFVKIH